MDQGSRFTSYEFENFCISEGIELSYFPVNNHRGTGSVERTVGGPKNFGLTYATEKEHKSLELMVNKALGALRFSKNATSKLNLGPVRLRPLLKRRLCLARRTTGNPTASTGRGTDLLLPSWETEHVEAATELLRKSVFASTVGMKIPF